MRGPRAARLAGLVAVACAVGCGRGAAPAAPGADAIAALEAELRARPGDGAVLYALAMMSDRAGDVDGALGWLARLAATPWDAGLDPADFEQLRARAAPRFAAARAAVERRWVRVDAAREVLRVGERDLLPEGMEVDPATGELLLSSGRKRKVVRVAADGTTRDLVAPAQDGLLATLGLRVDRARGVLWVASAAAPFMERADDTPAGVSRLHAFALATGALVARFELPAPSLLNDVAVLPDGRAVVTDSAGDAVWVTGAAGRLEPFVAAGAVVGPNGVAVGADGATVYVATWRGIVAVDVATRRIAPVPLPAGAPNLAGIDGLYVHGGALIGIQNAVGRPRVVRVRLAPPAGVEILESASPIVDNPTTGVIVDGGLVFMARRNRERVFMGGDPATLGDIVIARVPLPIAR
ncbi:MAG: SMP-30/gluconolactonase/LRE family protein [Kofleriaceae bacterium]|nr:SMP-30/gluconolactonase/LRE family protein [Kofleriaceae bacterium]